jgi:hypothetical protein
MLDQTGENTPAYFALAVSVEEKSFITLRPGVNVIKPFSLSMMLKQETFWIICPWQAFQAYLCVTPLKCSSLW